VLVEVQRRDLNVGCFVCVSRETPGKGVGHKTGKRHGPKIQKQQAGEGSSRKKKSLFLY